MKWDLWLFLFVCYTLYSANDGSHFRGGIISWRPLNNVPTGLTAQILLHQRYFWRRGYSGPPCTEFDVSSQTPVPIAVPLQCLNNCPPTTFPTLTSQGITTDCDTNPSILSVSGENYTTLTLPLTTSITIGFTGGAWLTNLFTGASGNWAIVNRLNLATRPDGFLNSSPVTTTLPVVLYPFNTPIVHVVQMADNDSNDVLRCRWSTNNGGTNFNQVDECSAICSGLPTGTQLFVGNNTCTLSFTLIVGGGGPYFGVALQIEDFFTLTSTTPMSSVPIQFLFYGYTASAAAGNCSAPTIIGVRPNGACIGVPANTTFTEIVRVQTNCSGQTIVDIVTSSPIGMTHSNITNPSPYIWEMTLTWTPQTFQDGPQGFCAGAIDNYSLQSPPWCITYLVDYDSPKLNRPALVQGSASPIGTVFSNQSRFAITANGPVGRPARNYTYIYFKDDATNQTVLQYDAGYASNIVYTGTTVVIATNYTWTPGKSYYVIMDSGFASGSEFCHAESLPISDKTFWRFDIWNPAVSSTTTTTTTPPTTHTVTTLGLSTSTINTLLTTTGISATNATANTTTSTASTTFVSTTTATTTAVITVSGVTTASTVAVMYPKDYENACKQPVAIMTVVVLLALMPIHAVAMYATFTKIASMYNPSNIDAKARHKRRMRNILRK